MAELTRLGRYQLKRVLGRGAMGVVYEGLDPSLNRRVAVKTILRNAAIDAETAQQYSAQFAREAQAAGRLNHPHIVQVHDFAEEGDVAYLVMEYIQGRELRGFFDASEKFDPPEAVRIMGELLDALDFAHEAGVIHRDVKPANVMLDAQRRVKLADFGVARIQDSERSAAGTMVGTPAFMSPEQISGGKIDRRTDLFSAGTILYQLLTGEQPFKGQGAWTVAKKIMQDDPPRPSSLVLNVPPAFDEIVNKALAKNPAQRYASAREFAAALRAAITAGTGAAPAAAAAPVPAKAPSARAQDKASEAEVEFWRAIQNSADHAEFEFYLEQFPEGTYAQLARHKIAKLREPLEAARKEAEQQAAKEAGQAAREAAAREQARKEAEELARQRAEEQARREAQERAREKARREAEARARAKQEAEAKAKREAEERTRQAQALERLRQQEQAAARAKATVDEDATVAIAPARPAPPAPPLTPGGKKSSLALPAVVAVLVIGCAVAAYFVAGRTPPPVAPVAEVAPPKPAAPAVDVAKIQRETEERLRKEFSEKAVSERAALEKTLAEKAAAEKAAAEKVAQAKTAAEKAAAEKAAALASADKAAAEKAAASKAAAEKAAAEKLASEKAAAERTLAEKAAVEKAAAEKAVTEKAAAEKVAAEKAAAEKAAAEKVAAEKAAAEKAATKAAARKPGWPAVGDRWVYEARDSARPERSASITVAVTGISAGAVTERITRPDGSMVSQAHLAVPTVENAGPGLVSFSPYLRTFQDLREGQRWSNIDFRQLFRCHNSMLSCAVHGKVAGRERVTVKAGSFDATKVVLEVHMQGTGAPSVVELRYWYAEAANRVVKYQLRTNATNFGAPLMDLELVSYTPAGG